MLNARKAVGRARIRVLLSLPKTRSDAAVNNIPTVTNNRKYKSSTYARFDSDPRNKIFTCAPYGYYLLANFRLILNLCAIQGYLVRRTSGQVEFIFY